MSTPDDPVWIAIKPRPVKIRETLLLTIVSVAPVIIAVLMQKPALRQIIMMKAFHYGKQASYNMGDVFYRIGSTLSTEYNKARM